MHWREMTSRSLAVFNAHQQARYDLILESIGDIAGKSVCDLGSGDGALSSLLAKNGAILTAVDNEPAGLKLAESIFNEEGISATFVLGSVEQIPLPDSAFDIVVSCDVIEHLDHYDKHVAEAARILRPGGVFAVTTPYRICETPAPFHTHEFYPSELVALAKPHFKEVTLRETHHMFWNSVYNYHPKLFRRLPIGKYLVNIMTLWFGINPFMKDSSDRKKRDYYTHLVMRCVK